MTPRAEMSDGWMPKGMLSVTAWRQRSERAEARAVRWEALARQLGDALTDFASEWEVNEHTNLSGDGGTWADCGECEAPWPCPTEQVRAALSVYRDAIKEDA